MFMKVVIDTGSNLGIIFVNNSPRAWYNILVCGMECRYDRDVEEGKVGQIFWTEARQVFYGVVASVLVVLEELFPIFHVEGRPCVGHCHVNKSSFACVFGEVNFLDHFLE